MTDWSGRDYADVSDLQRAMITDALAALRFARDAWVLDIGCGDGFLTRAVAGLVPDGGVVGVDASPRMITAAAAGSGSGPSPLFVLADARQLPFRAGFDAAVSFNALHWVPQQAAALAQLGSVLKPGGRATLQMVCAGARESLESIAMRISQGDPWAPWFEAFEPPFVHPDPDGYAELCARAGLRCEGRDPDRQRVELRHPRRVRAMVRRRLDVLDRPPAAFGTRRIPHPGGRGLRADSRRARVVPLHTQMRTELVR